MICIVCNDCNVCVNPLSSQGCSGDFGTERLWSPLYYTSDGVQLQEFPASTPVNITVPPSITGRGGEFKTSSSWRDERAWRGELGQTRNIENCSDEEFLSSPLSFTLWLAPYCVCFSMLYLYCYILCFALGTIRMDLQYTCESNFCSSE